MSRPQPTPWLDRIPAYVPGTSKDTIMKRFGIDNPIKLASNENPLGPSPEAIKAIEGSTHDAHLYPDPDATDLRKAASAFFGCEPGQIIAGNGSDEIIDLVCRAFLEPGDEVIIPETTFSYYRIASLACGARVTESCMRDHAIAVDDIVEHLSEKTKAVFIANPNNPTGDCLEKDEILHLIESVPEHTLLVIDEAYAAFVRRSNFLSAVNLISERENLLTIHTLSKSHGLAGLRVGFGIAGPWIMESLYRIKPPFNVNLLALKAGEAALKDKSFLRQTLEITWDGLDYLYAESTRLGLKYVPSQTNFVLMHIGAEARRVYEELLKRGIITRHMASYGLDDYIRVSVGLPEENRTFIRHLEEIL